MSNRTKRKKSLNKMPSLSIRNHVLQELRADRARSVAEFERADARRPRSKYREENLADIRRLEGRIAELSGLPVDNWQFSEAPYPRMRPARIPKPSGCPRWARGQLPEDRVTNLPHPSGANRTWNDRRAVEDATSAVSRIYAP